MSMRWIALLGVVAIVGCKTRPLHGGGGSGGVPGKLDGGVVATCGDGELDPGEECDDGNREDDDGCRSTCVIARCGDGVVRRNVEACDDGNVDDTDGCKTTCALPTCGDGIVQAPELCDDANSDDTDDCLSTCLPAFCGDGFVQVFAETCDDGNDDPRDGCVQCAPAFCGDGFVQRGVEACDDANPIDDDFCDNECRLPVCGDGRVAGDEECDDGNSEPRDACLTTCKLARCGDGVEFAGVEECDDGNGDNTDECVAGCVKARCGDGFVRKATEQCDDTNSIDDDFCDNQCRLPVCGDGRVAGSEACDLGKDNGDRPAFLITQPSGLAIATDPLIEQQSSADFYNYFSASSHTGFEVARESRAYLHVDANTGRLSLILTHGIDAGPGQQQPMSQVTMKIVDLPMGFSIDLSDDPGEFTATSVSTALGEWTFNRNSDGGILGGLPFPGAWKIQVSASFDQGIDTWGWVRDDLMRVPLNFGEVVTVEAFDSSTGCRKNCSVPRCGDMILDGGEVCDDGNNEDGDGCAADCSSLN